MAAPGSLFSILALERLHRNWIYPSSFVCIFGHTDCGRLREEQMLFAGIQRAHKLDSPSQIFVQMEFCYSCFLRDQQRHSRVYHTDNCQLRAMEDEPALVELELGSTFDARGMVRPHLLFDKNKTKNQNQQKQEHFNTNCQPCFPGLFNWFYPCWAHMELQSWKGGTGQTCMGLCLARSRPGEL